MSLICALKCLKSNIIFRQFQDKCALIGYAYKKTCMLYPLIPRWPQQFLFVILLDLLYFSQLFRKNDLVNFLDRRYGYIKKGRQSEHATSDSGDLPLIVRFPLKIIFQTLDFNLYFKMNMYNAFKLEKTDQNWIQKEIYTWS